LNGSDPKGNITLTISAPATSVSLSQSLNKWRLQKDRKKLTPHHLDCPKAFKEAPKIPLLCAWIGTIRESENEEMRPQILLLQLSRGLGGKAAAPGCYERVGVLDFKFWSTKKGDLATILKWFKDAEVREIKIV